MKRIEYKKKTETDRQIDRKRREKEERERGERERREREERERGERKRETAIFWVLEK